MDHRYYYHCSSQCGYRYKADDVNDAFVKELKKYTLSPELKKLTSKVPLDIFEQEASGNKDWTFRTR